MLDQKANIEEQLRTVVIHKIYVPGDVEVVPYVVCNRKETWRCNGRNFAPLARLGVKNIHKSSRLSLPLCHGNMRPFYIPAFLLACDNRL